MKFQTFFSLITTFMFFILIIGIGYFMLKEIRTEQEIWEKVCDTYSKNYTIEIVCSPYEPKCWNCSLLKSFSNTTISLLT